MSIQPHQPSTPAMKERQRWQPEEDALLSDYVKQYGPRDWSLVSDRMGKPLNRDPKSCLERWKNYLRPGLKKGSLSPDEQSLVITLQSKYGNKWKSIAAHLPGRTPKRLGKWWEVYKEKQHKIMATAAQSQLPPPPSTSPSAYDHILQTFAEKHVIFGSAVTTSALINNNDSSLYVEPSVKLTLSPPRIGEVGGREVGLLVRLCEEVEEGMRAWEGHRKEAAWRLRRVEQQMEAEKGRRKREKEREVEEEVRRLREEEREYEEMIEKECEERLRRVREEVQDYDAMAVMTAAMKQKELALAMQRLCFAAAAGGHCNSNGYGNGGEGCGSGGNNGRRLECFFPHGRGMD